MKVLVTGLCLQGNKGGPALALSLKKSLQQYLDGASFEFSVPAGEEFKYEQIWSEKYGIPVVESFSLRDFLPPFCLMPFPARLRRFWRWLQALRSADLVVEMSAITYVGPPIRPQTSVILGGRFYYFLFSRIFRKPFLAWTQSFGPFSTRIVRLLARFDLGSQPIIFCRGDDARVAVKELLPESKALSFPDVAVLLPYDEGWGRQYCKELGVDVDRTRIVTISPSAVLYGKAKSRGRASQHLEELRNVVNKCRELGLEVVVVPHTFRPGRHEPTICDFAVGDLLIESLDSTDGVFLVREDLSPMELKSIISQAHMHVGARYHSVVAAISSGVPAISLSWHPKYRDIMRMYGIDEFVHDSLTSQDTSNLIELIGRLHVNRDDIACLVSNGQDGVAAAVDRNVQLFVSLIHHHGSS